MKFKKEVLPENLRVIKKAEQSEEIQEEEFTSEEREIFEKIKKGAHNAISMFELKDGESLLIITDDDVDELVRLALLEAGQEVAGNDAKMIITEKPEHPAKAFEESVGKALGTILEKHIKNTDAVLLATSLSRTHSKETSKIINAERRSFASEIPRLKKEERENLILSDSRIISITTATREILTEGASQENVDEMKERVEKMDEVMKDVEKAHVTSELGTDLEVDLKKYRVLKEDGRVNKAGMADNFPSGEYAYSVNLENTNGTLVVDGATTNIGRVDEPITIKIKNGKAVSIEGGRAAEKLKEMLEKANEDLKKENPESKMDAFRVAEFSFGMNLKAFRYNEEREKICPPTSLEAEKCLGTIHIALGCNTAFKVRIEDPDYNDVNIHLDNVVMKPTVEGIKKDESRIKIIENGEFLIS